MFWWRAIGIPLFNGSTIFEPQQRIQEIFHTIDLYNKFPLTSKRCFNKKFSEEKLTFLRLHLLSDMTAYQIKEESAGKHINTFARKEQYGTSLIKRKKLLKSKSHFLASPWDNLQKSKVSCVEKLKIQNLEQNVRRSQLESFKAEKSSSKIPLSVN